MPNKKLNKIKVGNIYYDFGLIPETDLSINSLITNDISASNATINTLTIANDNILGPLNSDLTLKIGNKFNIYGSTSGSSSEYFRLFFDPEQTNFKIAYGTISKAAGHNISFNDVFSTIITPVSISTSGISTGTIYVENGIITTKNKLSVTPTPNTFSLPNKGGTIALTSDIPAPPKYYQHNIFGTFCDSPGETYWKDITGTFALTIINATSKSYTKTTLDDIISTSTPCIGFFTQDNSPTNAGTKYLIGISCNNGYYDALYMDPTKLSMSTISITLLTLSDTVTDITNS